MALTLRERSGVDTVATEVQQDKVITPSTNMDKIVGEIQKDGVQSMSRKNTVPV